MRISDLNLYMHVTTVIMVSRSLVRTLFASKSVLSLANHSLSFAFIYYKLSKYQVILIKVYAACFKANAPSLPYKVFLDNNYTLDTKIINRPI